MMTKAVLGNKADIHELSRSKKGTLKEQLLEILIEQISNGTYKIADKLPSVRELAEQFNISRETANLSLNLLNETGLVEVISGRGAFVIRNEIKQKIKEKTDSIGFLFDLGVSHKPTVGINTVYENLIQETDSAVNNAGLHMLISHICFEQASGRESFEALLSKVDGLIVAGLIHPELKKRLESVSIPVAAIYSNLELDTIDMIGIDSERSYQHLMEHILKSGHRNVVYLDGVLDTFAKRKRINGCRKALKDFDDAKFSLLNAIDWKAENAASAFRDFLKSEEKPDVVIAVNDVMASAVYQVCREKGLRIPEDIAVSGSKNTSLSTALTPALTSLDHHFKEVSSIAVKRLIQRINGKNMLPVKMELSAELIKRESVI